MKLFLKGVLFFLLPALLLVYPLDIFLSKQLQKSRFHASGEYSTWNDLYNGAINVEVAIYGSSRAWVQIDPMILERQLNKSAYNFGIDGHNFWLQYLRHKSFLKHNPKPQTIIISVDIFTLQKRPNLFNANQFLPYMLHNEEIEYYTSSYEGFSSHDYNIPLIRYLGKFDAIRDALKAFIHRPSPRSGRQKGYKPVKKEWNKDFERAKRQMAYYEVHQDSTSIKLFEEFLVECAADNIEVVMVYAPEYIEGQEFVKGREEVIRLYESFSEKYAVKFLNYSDDELCFDKKYFFNATHLNKRGAELFTQKLADDINANLSRL